LQGRELTHFIENLCFEGMGDGGGKGHMLI
jgi:hypothetical protein